MAKKPCIQYFISSVILCCFRVFFFIIDVRKKLCAHPMDVVFVLDGSDSVTRVNFDKVKKFTSDIIDEFDLSPAKVRVGVIEFSTFIGRVIELGQISSLPLLKFLISNISMSNDGTGTHKALKRMREMFQERGRPEVPRIGVVITDGLSVSPYLTKEEARLLHLDGVIIFAVGIEGDKTFQTELEYIASRKENALRVLDFDALPRNLSSSLCLSMKFIIAFLCFAHFQKKMNKFAFSISRTRFI